MGIPQIVLTDKDLVVRHVLILALGSRDAAYIVLYGMQLQAKYGACYASAAHLGYDVAFTRYVKRYGDAPEPDSADTDRIRHNAKILTTRLLSKMRLTGFITTRRRRRLDGKAGTLYIDFTPLWTLIWPATNDLISIKHWNTAVRRWRGGESVILVRAEHRDAGPYHIIPFGIPALQKRRRK